MISENRRTRHVEHVLVVDDDPAVAAVVIELLAAIGYETTAASGARDAIKLLSQTKPDVVITDIVMEDGEGMELIFHITRSEHRPPIIAMSGNPTGKLFLRASELLGVKAVLQKPFSKVALVEALTAARAGRRETIPVGTADNGRLSGDAV